MAATLALLALTLELSLASPLLPSRLRTPPPLLLTPLLLLLVPKVRQVAAKCASTEPA